MTITTKTAASEADTAANNSVQPILQMRNINKAFSGVSALTDASLTLMPGEVHAIIGQNGAGKSTLIKVLNGAHKLDSGDILYQGNPADFNSPHEAQVAGISTIFQEVNLIGYRSITENICLGYEPTRFGMVNWKKAHAHARSMLARFGLDLAVEKPLQDYNIAIQQLVAIARAVALNAKVVIMDEPTSSLDDKEKEVLFKVIRELQASGVAIVYVSHHLDELFQICDQVTIMRDGHTVAQHAIKDISKLQMVAAMLGRDIADFSDQTSQNAAQQPFSEVLLEVENLAGAGVLCDVSFKLHRGEILGLAGLLGAGRSEVARAIFGLDKERVKGKICVDNQQVSYDQPIDAINSKIGFCSEDRKEDGIIPQLSVRENLTLALMPKIAKNGLINETKEREIVTSFMRSLGIKASSMEQPISQLSGGNQQKVLLARWLATEPRILMLDEPTRGIDVGAKAEIQNLIKSLAKKGMTVLMISSEFEELVDGADRVIVIQAGKSVSEITSENLSENAIVQAVAHEAPRSSLTKGSAA